MLWLNDICIFPSSLSILLFPSSISIILLSLLLSSEIAFSWLWLILLVFFLNAILLYYIIYCSSCSFVSTSISFAILIKHLFVCNGWHLDRCYTMPANMFAFFNPCLYNSIFFISQIHLLRSLLSAIYPLLLPLPLHTFGFIGLYSSNRWLLVVLKSILLSCLHFHFWGFGAS